MPDHGRLPITLVSAVREFWNPTGCPNRGADDADVGGGKDGVERGGELAVPVSDQEPEPVGAIAEIHQQVTGLLGHPGTGRVGDDPSNVHAATLVLDHDENIEAAQKHVATRPTPRC